MASTSSNFGILVALLFAAIPLVALATRVNVSYPIVLVVSGLVLGFIPGLPRVGMDPDLVLLTFLPPLLYWGAITAPTEAMTANAGRIAILAFGLVVVTTLFVAAIMHAMVPGLPWAVALIAGAIISPTDELASVPVLERFRLPRQLVATVGGESLLNDASALVIYGAGMAVITTGAFNAGTTVLQFLLTLFGSTIVGYIAARIAVEIWKRVKDAQLQCVVSVTLPFLAYLPAAHFSLSGVLAVVTAGTYANHFTPRLMTPASRTQVVGFWTTLVFIANAILFMLVGLQLHDVAIAAFRSEYWLTVIGYALAVNVALIVVRLACVIALEYASPSARRSGTPNWRHALIVGWSGLRGAVSLAAALAIPIALPNGSLFPHRDLVIFITFTVILVTLVGGGLTLPMVIRCLHIAGGNEEEDELRIAVMRTSEAALSRISELERDGVVTGKHAGILRQRFEHRRDAQAGSRDPGRNAEHARHAAAERDLIETQRKALVEMRGRGEIDNVVLRRLLANLDLTAARLPRNLEDGS